LCGIAQADRVELEQHQVADQLFGQVGVLAQREGDVVEHGQVGEQRAELEQHAHLAAQAVQAVGVELVHHFAADRHFALLRADLAADQAQHGGLAAAGTTHDGDDLPAREVHAQVRQDERALHRQTADRGFRQDWAQGYSVFWECRIVVQKGQSLLADDRFGAGGVA
jgi:hypothetical protein